MRFARPVGDPEINALLEQRYAAGNTVRIRHKGKFHEDCPLLAIPEGGWEVCSKKLGGSWHKLIRCDFNMAAHNGPNKFLFWITE